MADTFGITPELVALLQKEEGWRSKPYICPAGYPTIGWGHRIPSLDHKPITPAEGLALLHADIRFHRAAVLKLSPILAQHEKALAAMIDFCFNLGPHNYATSTMKKHIDKGEWKLAAAQCRRWVYYRNPKTKRMEKLAGLISRRAVTAGWLESCA